MDDNALVGGLKSGDEAALVFFWEDYFDRIYPICAYILGDGPDALDATVDLMVDFVSRHVDRLLKPESLYAYLRLMAVRRSLRIRDRRWENVSLEESAEPFVPETAEDSASVRQLMPILDQCLKGLTPKTQKALRLKYACEFSNQRIGQCLGASKQYIGRLIRNGLTALRRCIENRGRASEGEVNHGNG